MRPADRIWNLNTPKVPQGVDEAKVRTTLLKDNGIEIAGGFGPLAGKIFRVGLMGPLATTESVNDFMNAFAKRCVEPDTKAKSERETRNRVPHPSRFCLGGDFSDQ